MEKGEPLAELEAGGGAICQGKASAEPIPQFCCGNLPKQAAPRQGGAWLDGGRKQSSTTVTLKKREAQKAFPPLSGCFSTLQLGPWTFLFFVSLTSYSFLRTQGQSPRNRDPDPSPGFSEALPLYPCLLFLKLSHQTLSHSFPPSGRRGCPPTGRLLWPRATQAGSQDGRLLGTCWLKKGP